MVVFSILIVLFYYCWTASIASYDFDPKHNICQYYNYLTDAILAHKFNLALNVPKELLDLPNPYNPKDNYSFRMGGLQDLALYKGKIYMYYGVAPVIFFYAPLRLIFNSYISDYTAVLFFMSCGFFCSVLLLRDLKNKYFTDIPKWYFVLAILLIGFTNLAPYFLRRLAHYQVAISCGYCFVFSGLYFLNKAIYTNLEKSFLYISFGSLFLGLATFARPNLIFWFLVLILFFYGYFKEKKNISLKDIIIFFLPYLSCIGLLMLYNFCRFDNPFEFGTHYTLTGVDLRNLNHNINFKYWLVNIYLYVFSPFTLDSTFPYSHIYPKIPAFITYPSDYSFEKMIGILPACPVVVILFLFPLVKIFLPNQNMRNNTFPWIQFLSLSIVSILILGFYFSCIISTLRYSADFMPLMIFASIILFFHFDKCISNDYVRAVRILFFTLSIVSIFNGFAFGIEGCEYEQDCCGLQGQSPEAYNFLSKLFYPIIKVISFFNF